MGAPTSREFLDALREYQLLDPAQVAEAERLAVGWPEGKDLARALLQRGWLTTFQVNQVAKGKAADLVLDQYLLLDLLGQGGMGAVYRALQRRMKRVVAVKIVRPDALGSAAAVARFQREAEIAARLSHPNIVTVHDTNEAHGARYLVMEYVEGVDLARLVRESGRLPVAQACDCVRQAALGLHYAHQQGLIHRDVKPANLVLTRQGVVKVLDLGLARLNDPSSAQGLTETGAVLGTADYIAPEQARNVKTIDARADIYSLGCTLYFLLTARVPHPGETLTEKLLKHQLEEPVPLADLRPDLPRELLTLVRRFMAKSPAERPATAGEAAALLAPFCRDGGPDTAPVDTVQMNAPPTALITAAAPVPRFAGPLVESVPALQPLPDRRRGSWLLAAVLAGVFCLTLGGALGGAILLWRSAPLPPVKPVAVGATVAGPTPADRTEAKPDPKLAREALERGQALIAQKRYDDAIRALNDAVRHDPGLAAAYFERATAYFSKGDGDHALADLADAARLQPNNAVARFNRGTIYEKRRDAVRAIDEFTAALRIRPGYAEALINRGALYLDQKMFDRALDDFNAVLQQNDRHTVALMNRAQVYVRQPAPDYPKALADLNRALEIDDRLATAYFNRSRLYTAIGEADKAKADMDRYRELTPAGMR